MNRRTVLASIAAAVMPGLASAQDATPPPCPPDWERWRQLQKDTSALLDETLIEFGLASLGLSSGSDALAEEWTALRESWSDPPPEYGALGLPAYHLSFTLSRRLADLSDLSDDSRVRCAEAITAYKDALSWFLWTTYRHCD